MVAVDALVDLEPRQIELPLPEPRLKRKTRSAAMATEHLLSVEEERAEKLAKDVYKNKSWSPESILRLSECLKTAQGQHKRGRAECGEGLKWTTGIFMHGGVAGLRGNSTTMKCAMWFLVEAANQFEENHELTAVGLLENVVGMGCHKDSHKRDAENIILTLQKPEAGAELWIEMRPWTSGGLNGNK